MGKRSLYLMLILFLINSASYSQKDYWSYLTYFTGTPTNHIPKGITIPDRSKTALAILNEIIAGASEKELKKKFSDSAITEIEKLVNGGVVEKDKTRFKTTFPVIIGDKREKIQKLIRNKIPGIITNIDSIINQLAFELKDRPDMIFHFLWSKIIDDCWWKLFNDEFNTDKGPPSIAFIVYPPHPMQCGTNSDYTSDDSQFALSWSFNFFKDFNKMPATESFYNLILKKPISDTDRLFFIQHGLLDSNEKTEIFYYYENSKLDSACQKLKSDYIKTVMGLFNYQQLSNQFKVPADELFLIISHELAYEIFQTLQQRKSPILFPLIKDYNPHLDFKPLVSFERSQPKTN